MYIHVRWGAERDIALIRLVVYPEGDYFFLPRKKERFYCADPGLGASYSS